MTTDIPDPKAFTLWFRKSRRYPWAVFAVAATESELTSVMVDSRRSGDFLTLLTGQSPDEKRRPKSLDELRAHPAIKTGSDLLTQQKEPR